MRHIYIIGNGFDLFTGLSTRYVDFRYWLEHNYAFIYENMSKAYEMKGEWWNDFEVQLGKLDVKKYVKRFTPPEKPIEEILEAIKERKALEEKSNYPPSLYIETPCAKRLKGLLDILQYCFEKWVDYCQRIITDPKYTSIERENSYFITFNYTDVLQWLYRIPDDRVLHIHGRASKHDHLVFGHGNHLYLGTPSTIDEEETCFELNRYQKNPYEYILRHEELLTILSDAEYVHVYGFSISEVDVDYLDWLKKNTPKDSKWEFSWHSEEDKRRINHFILEHWRINESPSLMQLQPISEIEALNQ